MWHRVPGERTGTDRSWRELGAPPSSASPRSGERNERTSVACSVWLGRSGVRVRCAVFAALDPPPRPSPRRDGDEEREIWKKNPNSGLDNRCPHRSPGIYARAGLRRLETSGSWRGGSSYNPGGPGGGPSSGIPSSSNNGRRRSSGGGPSGNRSLIRRSRKRFRKGRSRFPLGCP